MKSYISASLLLAVSAQAVAQDAVPAPIVAQPQAQVQQTMLPANTEVVVTTNEELSSSSVKEGQTFGTTVAQDVLLDGFVVIPRGTRAVGEVVWKTGKGAFGKSGKMEIELRYIDLGGQRIPLEGRFRQEGEGNTVATVAGVIAVGVFAGFITGKAAIVPRGRELTVHTKQPFPVVFAGRSAPFQSQPSAPGFATASVVQAAYPATGISERRRGESCGDYAGRVAGASKARPAIEAKCNGGS